METDKILNGQALLEGDRERKKERADSADAGERFPYFSVMQGRVGDLYKSTLRLAHRSKKSQAFDVGYIIPHGFASPRRSRKGCRARCWPP